MTKLTAKVGAKVSLLTPPNVLLISVRFLLWAPSNYEVSVSLFEIEERSAVVVMLNVEIFHDEDCDPCIPVLVDFQVLTTIGTWKASRSV